MRRGIAVSDTHCGSFFGLLPPGFVTFENVEKHLNAGQEYLWQCWLDFATRAEEFNPDFVIANGDIVDGLQRKSHGAELSLSNWRDQRQAAIATLKVLRSATKRAKWYFTQGTPYHTGHFGEAEEDIATALDATSYLSVGSGALCREVLTLDIDGVIIEAAHHISFASVYQATPLEKERKAALMDTAAAGNPMPDLIIRSHVHNYANVEQGKYLAVTTPAWQLQTRYMRKTSVHRTPPDLGSILIEIDPDAKKRGHTACYVEKIGYKLPPVPITKL